MQKFCALVFDLGGVILDIDQNRTLRSFQRMGIDLETVNMESTVFTDFEIGKIQPADFRHHLHQALKGNYTYDQIDEAWNKMLIHLPTYRYKMLEKLSAHIPLYLLSNTNSIHIHWFHQYIEECYGLEKWNGLFKYQFLSHQIGMRKPHTSTYDWVANQIGAQPSQCLFIDDSIANVQGAKEAGWHALLAKQGLDLHLLDDIYHNLQMHATK
ncbi:MAG: HAD family phosphatase [Bacteroidia bacterium]|jgi:putative hydrolase of the HAD superfamily|nr:HAD family phosphatase [Bacteroidia bacterium]